MNALAAFAAAVIVGIVLGKILGATKRDRPSAPLTDKRPPHPVADAVIVIAFVLLVLAGYAMAFSAMASGK